MTSKIITTQGVFGSNSGAHPSMQPTKWELDSESVEPRATVAENATPPPPRLAAVTLGVVDAQTNRCLLGVMDVPAWFVHIWPTRLHGGLEQSSNLSLLGCVKGARPARLYRVTGRKRGYTCIRSYVGWLTPLKKRTTFWLFVTLFKRMLVACC